MEIFMKKILGIFLPLIILTACSGSSWESYTFSENSFTVDLPTKPIEKEQPLSSSIEDPSSPSSEEKTMSKLYIADQEKEGYAVVVADLPKEVALTLDQKEFLDELLPDIVGQDALLTSKDIVYNNFPGKQFEASLADDAYFVRGRVYLIDTRVFELLISSKEEIEDDDAQKFWDSFVIDEIWLQSVNETIAKRQEEAKNPNWEALAPSGEGFSINMPGSPEKKEVSEQYYQTVIYSLQVGEVAYMASHSTYSQDINTSDTQAILNNAKEGFVNTEGGTLIQEINAQYGDFQGRQLEFEYVEKEYTLFVRYYLVGNKLYQAMIYLPTEQKNEDKVTSYLGSFAVGV